MILVSAILLITLTGPDNQSIDLNVDTIVTLKPPRDKDHFAPGTKCLITTTDGKFHTVIETCDEVHKKIEDLKETEP